MDTLFVVVEDIDDDTLCCKPQLQCFMVRCILEELELEFSMQALAYLASLVIVAMLHSVPAIIRKVKIMKSSQKSSLKRPTNCQ